MSINPFYLIAVFLLVLGAALMRNTDHFAQGGGDSYQNRRTRRLIGELVLLMSALALGIAFIS